MTAPDPKMLSASGTAGSTEPPHMPYSAVKMPYSSSQIHQHIPPCPGLMPSDGQVAQAPLQKSSSPYRRSFTQQKDHYDQMIHTVSVWSSAYPKFVLKSILLSAALHLYSSVFLFFVFLFFKLLSNVFRVLGG